MLKQANDPPEQQDRSPLLQLVHKYPLAFWGGLWTMLFLVGGVAALGLFSPGSLEQGISKPEPAPKTVRKPMPQETFPLSVFGAVVLGCAAGSLLVTQALRASGEQSRAAKRVKSSTARVRGKRRPPAKERRDVSRKPQPGRSQLAPRPSRPTANQLTQVTVLPPEESLPLDLSSDLAELMDLRKHQSLAALMRGNFQ